MNIREIKNIILTAFLGLLVLPFSLRAQQFSEKEVKAAFLCNFPLFIEWPENSFSSSSSPIIIGVLNDTALATITKRVGGNVKISGREIQVIQYKNLDEVKNCQILFIGSSYKNNLTSIVSKISDKPILTVGETEGFCKQKGMIGFSKKKSKFGFDINDKIARRSGIKISSKLLMLATIVE